LENNDSKMLSVSSVRLGRRSLQLFRSLRS
jgi:hypothetical protein